MCEDRCLTLSWFLPGQITFLKCPNAPAAFLCTSAKLHNFIHPTRLTEINLLPGIVLESVKTVMGNRRGSDES